LPDRAAANDRDALSRFEAGAFERRPSRCEIVADEDRGLIADVLGDPGERRVREGRAHDFRLRAGKSWAKGLPRAEESPFGAFPVIASRAPAAGPTGGEIGSDDVIADLDLTNPGANSDDVADEFVADDSARRDAVEVAGDDVEVGAADPSQRHTHECVRWIEKLGRRRIAQRDDPRPLEDDRAHGLQPNWRTRVAWRPTWWPARCWRTGPGPRAWSIASPTAISPRSFVSKSTGRGPTASRSSAPAKERDTCQAFINRRRKRYGIISISRKKPYRAA
jgi:hypothetical protein